MKLKILGCGTAAIRSDRRQASYLLEADGNPYLFDCGAGSLFRLLDLGLTPDKIKHLFITHFHNDHINDLPALLWSKNYGGYDPNPFFLYGPDGMGDYYKDLIKYILKKEFTLQFDVKVEDITNKEFIVDDLKITTKELDHYKNIAYRIERKGKVFVYSGDTIYCKELEEISKDADVLVLECGISDENPEVVHMSPKKCALVAKNANVKKLIVVHMYPELDDVDVKSIISKEFKGEIVIAKDLMEFEL